MLLDGAVVVDILDEGLDDGRGEVESLVQLFLDGTHDLVCLHNGTPVPSIP